MATKKSADEPEAETQEGDPNHVVDPPTVSAADAADPLSPSGTELVRVDQTAMLTLPSGASYALNAGQILELTPEDAAFITDQGYGSKVDESSGE